MKYLICNFKNKLTKSEIIDYVKEIESINFSKELVFLPSYPYLSFFNPGIYKLGCQDISSFSDEVITGEVTGKQLKSFDVSYCLVGHSERRIYKNEINIDFINKINHAQEYDLKIIYCIGETLEEKESNSTYAVLEKQISEVLNNVDLKDIIIAYEPVWAIGSGMTPDLKDIDLTCEFIKDTIDEKYNCNIDVLYGGSVNVENIGDINYLKNVDGVLIGGASLDSEAVKKMLKIVEEG